MHTPSDIRRVVRQRTFDHVLGMVYQQGRPALKRGTCAYRGEKGTKCGIGHILPDADYLPQFDDAGLGGGAVTTVLTCDTDSPTRRAVRLAFKRALRAGGADPDDVEFLQGLQSAHDQSKPDDNMEPKMATVDFRRRFTTKMETLAQRYGLEMRTTDWCLAYVPPAVP